MGENTKIEWAQHTFNPWIGCSMVSPGCDNCYACHRIASRLKVEWGPDGERRVTSAANWRKPRTWNKQAFEAGNFPVVFCASLGDVFEDRDELVEPRQRLWQLIDETPHLCWALLTKRPRNIHKMVPRDWKDQWPINVMTGVSVEYQECADDRLPWLLKLPGKHFASLEPLLGPVDLRHVHYDKICEIDTLTGSYGVHRPHRGQDGPKLNWVIVGGETGKHARPMHPEWIRQICYDCDATNTPFFFKHWGEWHPLGRGTDERRLVWHCGFTGSDSYDACRTHSQAHIGRRCEHTGLVMRRVGRKRAGRSLNEHVIGISLAINEDSYTQRAT
jgi:protein gp37